MTTLGRRVGHRRARMIALASLLPDTGLCDLFSLANSKWLYRHLSVARASLVRRQGAPRAGEVGNLGGLLVLATPTYTPSQTCLVRL
ncbi:jg4585 [Pararge aegeria aegeria]|uniref:Jg4585 protein n=1 Tax=Pararge aegeria aegeria TaxID=348720 RepID=A0A8S4QUL1_9NEOP|nr:jg4585 [Pararge aegeria aegeria]